MGLRTWAAGSGHVDWTSTLRGVLFLAVLAELSKGERYGYELAEELARQGVPLAEKNPKVVYAVLVGLRGGGERVTVRQERSDAGPDRLYYSLTPAGHAELERGVAAWQEATATLRRLGLQV